MQHIESLSGGEPEEGGAEGVKGVGAGAVEVTKGGGSKVIEGVKGVFKKEKDEE